MNNEEKILQILTRMESDISGVKSDVTGLKSDVAELKSDVSGLKSDVAELKSDVTGLKSDVSELKSDVSGLKSDVTGLKSDVAGLKSKLDKVASVQELTLDMLIRIEERSSETGIDVLHIKDSLKQVDKRLVRLERRAFGADEPVLQ